MRNMMRMAVAVAVTALALSACGKRGALEPPPAATSDATTSDGYKTQPGKRRHGVPDRPFILDGLL